MSKMSVVSVYVSHFSENYIDRFSTRHREELGRNVYVVNSSTKPYESEVEQRFCLIEAGSNVGFSKANNIGIKRGLSDEPDFFLIINPDVLLPPQWLSKVSEAIDQVGSEVGIFTVPLLGYDFEADKATGLLDGVGIGCTWFGRWYDIWQGEDENVLDKSLLPYDVMAACGALMLIRREVICELLDKDGYVFNESYLMYKEDIELSTRARLIGWRIVLLPSVPVFHCRGWGKDRRDSPYWARLLSAKNELKMHARYYWRYLPYSILKYLYIIFLERFFVITRDGTQ